MNWIKAGIVVLSFGWFPHSLARIQALGYDFPIYYASGQGEFVHGWLYPNWTGIFFWPFTLLPMDAAFAVWYALIVLVWLWFAGRMPIVAVLAAYPMLLSLELGQVAPMLALLCLSLPGSLLAGCLKPYLFVFSAVHSVILYHRLRAEYRRLCPEGILQDESSVPLNNTDPGRW